MKYYIILVNVLIIISCSKTPNDPPIASYQGVEAIVTFSVNISPQIQQGNFDSESDLLYMVGSFNNWDETSVQLLSVNNDKYEISFTNFEVGTVIEFKFKINNNWETPNPSISDCVDNGMGGYNRTYTVEQGVHIKEYWYNDEDGN